MEREREQAESKRHPVAAKTERCYNLARRTHPCGHTQINRNELISDVNTI